MATPHSAKTPAMTPGGDHIICGECERARAFLECEECRDYFCYECGQAVHQKGRRKTHNLLTLGQGQHKRLCEVHDGEKLTMYCLKCEKTVCAHCLLLGTHVNHACQTIREAYSTAKESLRERLAAVSQSKVTLDSFMKSLADVSIRLQKESMASQSEIKTKIDELRAVLDQRENDMLTKVRSAELERVNKVKEQAGEIRDALNAINHHASAAQELVERSDAYEFFAKAPSAFEALNVASRERVETESRVHASQVRTLDVESALAAILSLEMRQAGDGGYFSSSMQQNGTASSATNNGALTGGNAPFVMDTMQCTSTLLGHQSRICCLAVSGRKLFSGSGDDCIKVWDMDTLACKDTLYGHRDYVRCLAVAGVRLYSGSDDRTIKVWDVETLTCIETLTGHEDSIRALAIAGRRLYSASDDRTIRVWDMATLQAIHTLVGHKSYVYALVVNGKRMYSGSYDDTIKVWDLDSFECLYTLTDHNNSVCSLAISGWRLFSGSGDKTIRVWDLETMQCQHMLAGHEDSVRALTVMGDRLFSAGDDGTIRVWDMEFMTCKRVLTGHAGWVCALLLSDNKLFSGGDDHSIKVWE